MADMHDALSQIAIDALLHGLRYMRDAAARTIAEIEHARHGAAPPAQVRSSGWPADPEERKREMARRNKVTLAKRKAATKKMGGAAIRDKEAWRKSVSKAAKAAWAKLTPAERAAKIARITAGRRKKEAA
jgi:hypothetical protein